MIGWRASGVGLRLFGLRAYGGLYRPDWVGRVPQRVNKTRQMDARLGSDYSILAWRFFQAFKVTGIDPSRELFSSLGMPKRNGFEGGNS